MANERAVLCCTEALIHGLSCEQLKALKGQGCYGKPKVARHNTIHAWHAPSGAWSKAYMCVVPYAGLWDFDHNSAEDVLCGRYAELYHSGHV